ncbi:hypothetical protein B0H14DRAFT_2647870 [Mycena olivaceomarginata]|nr:hypothetical protein B0H14DRAFT_2647870 [Mycena olivaceomarginata]
MTVLPSAHPSFLLSVLLFDLTPILCQSANYLDRERYSAYRDEEHLGHRLRVSSSACPLAPVAVAFVDTSEVGCSWGEQGALAGMTSQCGQARVACGSAWWMRWASVSWAPDQMRDRVVPRLRHLLAARTPMRIPQQATATECLTEMMPNGHNSHSLIASCCMVIIPWGV